MLTKFKKRYELHGKPYMLLIFNANGEECPQKNSNPLNERNSFMLLGKNNKEKI